MTYGSLFIAGFLVLLSAVASKGQIQIDTTLSPERLVKKTLIGKGVVAGNVKYTGEGISLGVFTDSAQTLGLSKGIMLTSGNAFSIKGPNNSNYMGWVTGAKGDADLEKYTDGITYDAAVLEFDFITASENLVFNFVFASEEYIEYVDSRYNDVFAFIVDGPGVTSKNLALLPGTGVPIAINNVNHKRNKRYYNDNRYRNISDEHIWDVRSRKFVKNPDYQKRDRKPPYHTQYDGFTTVLQASCKVIPNEVYHIKIAIADVSDGILDSGVLLEAESFSSSGMLKVPIDSFHFGIDKDWLAQLPPDTAGKDREAETSAEEAPGDSSFTETFAVYFDFDSCGLDTRNRKALEEIHAENMQAAFDFEAILRGHTDNKGADDYNLALSECRMKTVKRLLIGMGVPGENLIEEYYGERQPVDTNKTARGRANNRRVEIQVIATPVESARKKQ